MKAAERKELAKLKERIETGELADQKCWSFIRDLNSYCAERLDSVAIHDGYRKYTYRQMFRAWERYAEAFSAINITSGNRSRVGLIGVQQTETVFAFYGLNMTGASVSLIYFLDMFDEKRIRAMIEREKITDLVISEVLAFPKVIKGLLRDKELLGLRNIVLLESPMGGEYGIAPLEIVRKMNASMFRELSGGLVMEDLMRDYEATPIAYGALKSTDGAVIMHTTGTVSGIHKPIPMSDKALNSFVLSAIKAKDTYEDFKAAPAHMISFLGMNMSWVYAMVDMLHTSLGLGMEVVCLPFGVTNPRYSEAIEKCGINILFASIAFLDTWIKTMPDVDLSKVKIVFMGGTYISPEVKKQLNDYLRSCGSSARIINGYGLSELCGACIVAPAGREDDAIGYPLPGFKVKIFSEDEKKFYDLADGPRTGVLYLSSPTMSTGKLESTVFFSLEKIGDEEYFNTNDLVRVNEDGSLTCIGRSNQFFVNNAGIRFDAGLVENAISAQPGIAGCGIVPEFHKMLHDNVPTLYVETSGSSDELGTVRNALIQVFIKDGKLAETNLPSMCVLVDSIPRNSGGKVDTKKLASGLVEGRRFNIKHVKLNDAIDDILLLPAPKGESATMSGGLPEELENDPYNILTEIFAAIPEIKTNGLSRVMSIPGFREIVLKLTDFDVKNIPASMTRLAPKLMKLSIDQFPAAGLQDDNAKNALKNLLSMFEGAKAPKSSMTASLIPFLPPLPPVLPVFPALPMFPAMGWGWTEKKKSGKDESLNQWDDFRKNMETFMEQMREMQKMSIENYKEKWDQARPQFTDMRDSITSSLPDEIALPGLPPLPVSPRKFVEQMNEFQKTAADYAREQADTCMDFLMQRQQKMKAAVSDTMDNIETAAKEPAQKPDEK